MGKEIVDFYVNHVFHDTIFILYLVTVAVDIITGNAVALYQRRWSSKTGINGTIRHFALFVVMIGLLPFITFVTNIAAIANGVMLYVVAQYTISVLENLSSLGIDINEGFGKYFEFLNHSIPEDKQNNKE